MINPAAACHFAMVALSISAQGVANQFVTLALPAGLMCTTPAPCAEQRILSVMTVLEKVVLDGPLPLEPARQEGSKGRMATKGP